MQLLCSPPPPHGSETTSVITIHSISETTSPSHFLPADFQGNRRRLVCYQGGSPGLSEQLSKRHLWEWCVLVSVCLQRPLPNEVTLLQKRGWRDSRRGGWKKPGQEVEQSVAQGSAPSTPLSGNVDFSFILAHRLKRIKWFPSHHSLIPFSHHKNNFLVWHSSAINLGRL